MPTSDAEFWRQLCERFRAAHSELYRSWFEQLPPGELHGGRIVIRVDDRDRAHYLREHCAAAFSGLAGKLTGHLVTVEFQTPKAPRSPQGKDAAVSSAALDADYTFDQFVVGSSNRLAHAACRAVCEQPGTVYNPLFVHGPSGLGKSHLMQATCAATAAAHPHLKIVYVSCETFINEFISAIESGKMEGFRERYRLADVLAIDDVQYLAKRETSQEEVFHTFNALFQAHRQIILSADAWPREIPTLEDRLISRFNWGLVAPIAPPDHETRRAILQKKARLRGYEVPDEILELIAERVDANIRLLEGALIKVVSQAQLNGEPLSRETAERMLDDLCGNQPSRLQIGDILDMVSDYYGIRLAEILGKKRTRAVVQPRQVGMYLARKLTSLSLEEIGGHFGGRDHSTVLHAQRAVEQMRKEDHTTEQALAVLSRRLIARR